MDYKNVDFCVFVYKTICNNLHGQDYEEFVDDSSNCPQSAADKAEEILWLLPDGCEGHLVTIIKTARTVVDKHGHHYKK